ncbi:phosphomannomutase [endosymbiont of Acanthamoeba sp. UWC8]|uniref:phosphoglucomutase/phosphomannomutase PgmG n=1 Tax=endosymbiont of Acanthamoeba sp. UWC8 TaxID=86106 RepID=UPI0004D1ECF8|nr:phosphomannomutase/phosphoglucomutase [endosymbiont of Acanthamoeba sp. UWC8]AIF81084.1 phosphomannomutase [endosymbiont of Acanthamoeba sp. UWC8]
MKALKETAKHFFDQEILRKYDIRGTFGKNLNEADAYYLGKSFAVFLHNNNIPLKVCVGYDGRISSPSLEKELTEGLSESNVEVVRIGLVPTPVLYFATHFIPGAISGIMVTGSHNPPDQNGFKMVADHASVFDNDISELGEIAKRGKFIDSSGEVKTTNIIEAYLSKIIKLNTPSNSILKKLKVVWDPANGAACEVIKQLVERLPGEHKVINGKVDGTFPSHHADPTQPENLVQLIDEVKKEGADLGIAFDGDGDRIGVVDSEGRILYGDQLLMIYAKDLLSRNKNAKIIADVKTSQVVFESIRNWGGEDILWKTGHSLIKQKMKEENAMLAGEMSGHVFFAEDYYGYDDAIFAAVRLLKILYDGEKSLTEIYDELPKTISTPEIRIECTEKRKFKIIDEVTLHAKKLGLSINNIDGVRVNNDLGWWLVRASNTQNCLVVRVESLSEAGLNALCKELFEILEIIENTLDLSPLSRFV